MWRDYLPDAKIYGIDIEPRCIFQEDRISTYVCDASNPEQIRSLMNKLGGNFDVILEDASHLPAHQIIASNIFPEFLSERGVFMIEDVFDWALNEVTSSLIYPYEVKKLQHLDHIHHPHLHSPNDNIIVIFNPNRNDSCI